MVFNQRTTGAFQNFNDDQFKNYIETIFKTFIEEF